MRWIPVGNRLVVSRPLGRDTEASSVDFSEDDEGPDEPASALPEGPLVLTRLCLELSDAVRNAQKDAQHFLQNHRELLGLEEGSNLLQAFLDRVWPHQAPTTLIASNISFNREHPQWLLRPVNHGPNAASYAALHQTLAMIAYRRKGRLVVKGFELAPHVAPRDHELEVTAPLFWNPSDLYMEGDDLDAMEELPFHREETQKRLESWRAYLNWKEELIKKQQLKVPYLAWQWTGAAQMSFLVKQADLPHRLPEGQDLSAIPPEPEQDRNEQERPKRPPRSPEPIKIGEVDGVVLVEPRNKQARELWEEHLSGNAPLRQISFRLDEDHASVLRSKTNPLPPKGVLVSSIVRELAPLKNQRHAIDRLQNSQGFCPRLADFLFSSKSASLPSEPPTPLEPIPGTRQLNPGQALAVAKTLAAPDLSLIQGPPGTGKTTVIAELCLRVARQGGRVLVTSQTNLAVDNALSRLVDRPELRRLRIGEEDRVDDDFREFWPTTWWSAGS